MHNEVAECILPGWTCPACLGFNGEAKEELTVCRACGERKPGHFPEVEMRDVRPMHMRVEQRFCVLELRPESGEERDPTRRLPATRTFVVYAPDTSEACAQVRDWYEKNFPLVKVGHLTAAPAGTEEPTGVGPTGDVVREVVGDATASPSNLWEGRTAPNA